MSGDRLIVVAAIGFLVAGILVATVVAVIDNLFIYKRRGRQSEEGPHEDGPGGER
jgi:hypothetical protein